MDRADVASAVRISDMIGVIPLPPAKATISESVSRNRNRPSGGAAWISAPSDTVSFSQFDTSPPGSRLTVIRSSSSTGADDIE